MHLTVHWLKCTIGCGSYIITDHTPNQQWHDELHIWSVTEQMRCSNIISHGHVIYREFYSLDEAFINTLLTLWDESSVYYYYNLQMWKWRFKALKDLFKVTALEVGSCRSVPQTLSQLCLLHVNAFVFPLALALVIGRVILKLFKN